MSAATIFGKYGFSLIFRSREVAESSGMVVLERPSYGGKVLAVVRAAMLVILDAVCKFEGFADDVALENAIEVDPLAAVLRLRGTAKCLFEAGGSEGCL
jgi:hypothetical protein